MSKTYEKKSVTKATQLSRQFAAWVTGLRDRYRSDIFFNTIVHVVALQALFVTFVLTAFWFTISSAEEAIGREVINNLINIINRGAEPNDIPSIVQRAQMILRREFLQFFAIAGGLIVLFGYGILRATLQPTQGALRAQKMFISNIAHELRTPLSIIKTNLEVLLLQKEYEINSMKERMKNAVSEIDRASSIINNLLSLDSFLQPNRIRFTNVDLGHIVDEAVFKMRELGSEKQINISIKKRGEYRTVWGNASSLEQIVSNLLRNALRYTPTDGHVVITVEPDYRGYVALTISDTGTGIGENDLFHIFEPYYRGEKSREQQANDYSSGLGLTIVSEMVKSHHGKIYVQSAIERGTTVQILLPCGKEQEPIRLNKCPTQKKHPRINEIAIDFSR